MPETTVKFKIFQSDRKSWETLFAEAADFGTECRERLITITVTAQGGMDLGGFGANGIVTVWYWTP